MFHAERISVLQYMWRSEPNNDDRRISMLPNIIDDVVGTFERMRDEGKVGCLMTFPYTVPVGKVALATKRFTGLLGYYNPLTMELTEFFPEMDKQGLGFIAIRPYYEGLLTDKRPTLASLPPDDRLHVYDTTELFRMRDAVAATFRDEIDGSMTRFALKFPLYSHLTASVVVGLNTEQQVHDAVEMVGQVVPRPDLIERAFSLWKSAFAMPA
jgi:aryl-alcohol dehydrogenase-like predicted oxidoreductase